MLTYYLDVETHSRWLRSISTQTSMALPFYCSEAGVFYARKRFSTERSGKDSYLLFYTTAGEGVLEQNGTQIPLTAGNAVLFNCRTPHRYATAPHHSHWDFYWAHIDGAGVAAIEALLNADQTAGVSVPMFATKETMQYIISHAKQPDIPTQSQLCLRIHTVLDAMMQKKLAAECAIDPTHRAYVMAVADSIRTQYRQPLSLETLLEKIPLSKYYFIKLFRQYMGTTPYQYLLCYRLAQSKELLGTTQQSVGEIALYVGFASESNFSAQFAKRAGQTPGEYRKQLRTETQQ